MVREGAPSTSFPGASTPVMVREGAPSTSFRCRVSHHAVEPQHPPAIITAGGYSVVPTTGLEPVRRFQLRILSPLRLPFRQAGINGVF